MIKDSSYLRVFCWRGFVYLAVAEREIGVGISHNPGLDRTFWLKRGYQQFQLLTPPLPLGAAAFLCDWLKRYLNLRTRTSLRQVAGILDRGARKIGLISRSTTMLTPPEPVPAPEPAELDILRRILAGRILWLEEVAQALAENKLGVNRPLVDLLHWLYLEGEVTLMPGVGYDPDGQPRCLRCGQANRVLKVACHTCRTDDCLICEGCLAMGQARRCRPLYAVPWPQGKAMPGRSREVHPQLSFQLTPAQADAYREAESFVRRQRDKQCLLWAACGAGKTEVAYGAIATALSRGRNILYTCPRREVIRELYPRFVAAWPGVRIQALYGGSPGKYAEADIYLATTHQAVRFYRRFDLVILDEVDAYPLAGEPMLYYAVERACREKGQTLWLTATPPAEIAARASRRQVAVIYLPARHHGRPLPVPQIIREPQLKWPAKGYLPRRLNDIIKLALKEYNQLLIFVPAVNLVDAVVEGLAKNWPDSIPGSAWVRGCYASHPRKEETIASFCRGEFPVLVTTTVMERGITIPRISVLVLYADEERIFSANTLIQVAGRTGRSTDCPEGRVWFMARRISPAMAAACRQINQFNRLARQRGYLIKE